MPASALILTAVAAAAGALYLTAFATSGDGLAIELAGAGTGVLLGLLAASRVRLEYEPATGNTFTRAGTGYALIWIATAAVRLAFIYGSRHWFSANLDSWMLTHHVTADALTDALIVMALAMTSARTLSLILRSRLAADPQSRRLDAGIA